MASAEGSRRACEEISRTSTRRTPARRGRACLFHTGADALDIQPFPVVGRGRVAAVLEIGVEFRELVGQCLRKKVSATGSSPLTRSPRAQRGASKTLTSGSMTVRGAFLTSTESADAAPAKRAARWSRAGCACFLPSQRS